MYMCVPYVCIKFEQDFLHSAKCRAPAVHSPCLGWYLVPVYGTL
jgi:hypothetical protein